MRNTSFGAGLEAAGMDGGRIVDRRLGYSLELPLDHQRLAEPIVHVEEGIEVNAWGTADGRSAIGVFVQPWAFSGWTVEALLIENEQFFTTLWGSPTAEHAATLDGEPGQHLRWDGPRRRDLLIVNRDRTVYMLLVESDDPDLFARTRERFTFVE